MKIPNRIQPLVDDGLVDEVISRLMSGKEADVYVVRCGDENSRNARAMEKGSKYGRQQHEEVWQNTEVDALFKLAAAGVRVPRPHVCLDGVLLMELVTDADGNVAPRLNDVALTREQALIDHGKVIRYVVRMLCAGLIHGDLSEFNVLVDAQGPVIIDLPQVVDAAANNQAKAMLERDVNNMRNYYGMYAPELLKTRYAREMWALFEDGKLGPETELTGLFEESREAVDLDGVLHEIESAQAEAMARRARQQAEQEEGF